MRQALNKALWWRAQQAGPNQALSLAIKRPRRRPKQRYHDRTHVSDVDATVVKEAPDQTEANEAIAQNVVIVRNEVNARSAVSEAIVVSARKPGGIGRIAVSVPIFVANARKNPIVASAQPLLSGVAMAATTVNVPLAVSVPIEVSVPSGANAGDVMSMMRPSRKGRQQQRLLRASRS
jgi:hypothetical protein